MEPTNVPAVEPVVEPTQQVTPAEPVAPIEPVEPQEPVAAEPQEPVPTEPKKYRIKVDGQDIEVDEGDVVTLAQKGYSFDKKMQAISEWERANQQKVQLADQLMNNPNAQRYVIAQQLGYDPNMVLGNIQPPDPTWKDLYPEQFGRQQAYYELADSQKQKFESHLNQMLAFNAQSANSAVFEKARLEHDLNEEQFGRVHSFVTQRMRPTQAGFYAKEDVDYAVMALMGNERTASAKLKQADNIQKIIKEATRPSAPVSQRPVTLNPQQQENAVYKKYVEELNKSGWK